MIAIVDYGAGNIFSVKNALDYLNLECTLTSNKDEIISSDAVILPGVGAFPEAMRMLEKSGLVDTIKEQAEIKPFLGICLGMQLMFEKGYEFEECDGLGLINGSVQKMDSSSLIIPHMGWNKLETLNDCKLLDGLSDNAYVYFVHSYKAVCDDKNISAYCEYDGKVPALVYDGNFAYGAQFHPEKSGETGLKILKNFGGLIK
ncbi:MAG: imidazole glycerol phosphate synthase subunit HisH [Ruminococcus sp.]|nr:imidazole glycerol phosphate synthase subunit HisH [Ruminococcus sp.]MCI6888791.1 imidazole glycerol phosphate synthase subunit HisH [Ruminococcus sp.]MDY3214570.1 imidazole glycerol phosphate synthase subunit HisH [Ruminococcus sp.]HOF68576.1 imidazole glycerol phosphate synthase subunit HisH [Ruminococcus sp.]